MPFKRGSKWVGKVVHNGTQHWCGQFDTKVEARRAEDALRDELLYGAARRGEETCDAFAHRWADDYPRPKPGTNRHNEERVRQFADDFKGVPLRQIDRPTARAWAMRNPLRLAAVRAMYTDAVNDGLVEINPFAGLRLPKGRGRRDIEVIPEKELYRIASTAPKALGTYGGEFAALFLFSAYVGLRPGELFMIRWEDISGQYLHISRAVDKHGNVGLPKNGKPRTVTIPPPAAHQLVGLPKDRETVFRSKTGRRLTHGTLFYAWNQVRSLAGHPGLDFYEATRHVCATYLLERGLSASDVAVQLGHTDGGALILSTYGHPSEEAARKRVLAAFDDYEAPSNVTPLRRAQ